VANYGPISYDIDLSASGKQIGALSLDHSDDANAYSTIQIPIAVIANGEGPTVLFIAGNHGNEYEGQVALREFVRRADPADVRGRIIILPSLNMPAARADARVSPLDGANLNRAFPGSPDDGPTAAIAGFVNEVVLPLCDAGVDIHTGGAYANFIPLVYICRGGDESVFSSSVALAEAFSPPWIYSEAGVEGGIDPHARRQGVAFFSTELGGGARLGKATTALAKQGVRNVLAHLDVLSDPVEPEPSEPCRYLTDVGACRLVSPAYGFLESVCSLGQTVSTGETLAIVHPVEDAFADPISLLAPGDGVVVTMRTTVRVKPGDVVLDVSREVTREAIFA
jgi:predicted deacylase